MFEILSNYIDRLENHKSELLTEYLDKFCDLSFTNEDLDKIQNQIHEDEIKLEVLCDLAGEIAGGKLE